MHIYSKKEMSVMNNSELDLLDKLAQAKSTTKLFITAFIGEQYPADSINALSVIAEKLEEIEVCAAQIGKELSGVSN